MSTASSRDKQHADFLIGALANSAAKRAPPPRDVKDADMASAGEGYGLRSGVSIVPEQRDSTVPETNVCVATVASARYSETPTGGANAQWLDE